MNKYLTVFIMILERDRDRRMTNFSKRARTFDQSPTSAHELPYSVGWMFEVRSEVRGRLEKFVTLRSRSRSSPES